MPNPDQVAFQFSGQDVSLNQVLMLPVALLRGYFALNFLVLLVLRRMTQRGTNPDLVQVTRRLLNIAVLLMIPLTALQILKARLTAFSLFPGRQPPAGLDPTGPRTASERRLVTLIAWLARAVHQGRSARLQEAQSSGAQVWTR